VQYLDNILIFGASFEECLENCRGTINLEESLGFIVKTSKSILESLTYLYDVAYYYYMLFGLLALKRFLVIISPSE